MGREGMSEGMAGRALDNARHSHCVFHSPLYQGFIDMMSALFSSSPIDPTMLLWKEELPAPFGGGIGILARPHHCP
jgi:hypothetical protein